MSQFSEGSLDLAVLQRQIEVLQYVCAGSAAVFIWDILNNVWSEYSLLFKHRPSVATVAYVMSRIGALIFVLGFTIFASYPFKDCNTVLLAFNSFLTIGVCGTAFLFFYRVCSIYGGDRLVVIVFGCLWLAAVGSAITIPIGESGLAIGDPSVCIISRAEAYVGSSAIILTVQNTVTFLAISYRLVSSLSQEHQAGGKPDRAPGSGVNPRIFLRSLFMDGQMYYMIVVLINISATLVLYIPSVPLLYHGLLVVPNITLTSVMACRVYRNKVLGVRRPPELTLPTLNRSTGDANTIPLSVVQFQQRTDMTGSLHLDSDESNITGDKKRAPESTLQTRSKAGDASPSRRSSQTNFETGVS